MLLIHNAQGYLGWKYHNGREMAMAAENGIGGMSEFVVDKGKEVDEKENDEEIAEISLSPDLEAEEARKEELRLQAQKVKRRESVSVPKLSGWHVIYSESERVPGIAHLM